MAWCRQATSHCLSQCWSRSMSLALAATVICWLYPTLNKFHLILSLSHQNELIKILKITRVVQILPRDKRQGVLHSQYQCCWWPGDRRNQGINISHGTDLVLNYSRLNNGRVTRNRQIFNQPSSQYVVVDIAVHFYILCYVIISPMELTHWVLAVTCFGLKINDELPSCIAKDIFKALFVDDLAICFRGRSLDTIERHLQQAVNAIQEWATKNGFRFAAHKCKVMHFTAPRSRAERPPIVRIGNTLLPVEESTKFLGLWWDSYHYFKKHISVLKTQCKEALNLIRVVAHLKWGGDRDTLLMLYRAIVRSKFDYGCIV